MGIAGIDTTKQSVATIALIVDFIASHAYDVSSYGALKMLRKSRAGALLSLLAERVSATPDKISIYFQMVS